MYYLDHYVIDWDNVKTLDDIKRILAVSIQAFERTVDVSTIQDLVVLEKKYHQQTFD